MNLAEQLNDEAWNQERERLQQVVTRAATELILFSGACRAEFAMDGVKIVIEALKPARMRQ